MPKNPNELSKTYADKEGNLHAYDPNKIQTIDKDNFEKMNYIVLKKITEDYNSEQFGDLQWKLYDTLDNGHGIVWIPTKSSLPYQIITSLFFDLTKDNREVILAESKPSIYYTLVEINQSEFNPNEKRTISVIKTLSLPMNTSTMVDLDLVIKNYYNGLKRAIQKFESDMGQPDLD